MDLQPLEALSTWTVDFNIGPGLPNLIRHSLASPSQTYPVLQKQYQLLTRLRNSITLEICGSDICGTMSLKHPGKCAGTTYFE
jgi:hypothetical protein